MCGDALGAQFSLLRTPKVFRVPSLTTLRLVQAATLATTIKERSSDELLKLAQEKRKDLEDAGELDEVGDEMPDDPPSLDESMVGTKLERGVLALLAFG